MNVPVFSIIIPAYNIDKYITDCLESLSAQTLDREYFEVIKDPGSVRGYLLSALTMDTI